MLSFIREHFFIRRPRLRRAITKLIAGNSDREIQVLGTPLTINTIREHGYLRAARLIQRSTLLRYEVPVLINLAFLLNDGDTFVDVGANVGFYAHTVARFATLAQIRIYAFEAHPDTYLRLVHMVDKIQAEQVAISDRPGMLEFCDGAVSNIFTERDKASTYHDRTTSLFIPTRRLDECNIVGNSIVVKIDVEGQELEVLRSAEKLFMEKRVKAVYIDGYESNNQVLELLQSWGFGLYDGRTLEKGPGPFSMLAIHPEKFPTKRIPSSVSSQPSS